MSDSLKLMCVLAHPDDESLGTGGILAKYGQEGVQTYLLTATRGEYGWEGPEEAYPGPEALGRIREAELETAARVLNIREHHLLEYTDGALDQADPVEAVSRIVFHLRRVKPHVVVTFGPDGAYGHPDHIAISQLTTAALICAADPAYEGGDGPPHRVLKFYFKVWTETEMAAYQSVFGDLVMDVDGVQRKVVGWEPWAITTRVDTTSHWPIVWEAVRAHRSQLPAYQALAELTPQHHEGLWSCRGFYRAFSMVNGGRKVEEDLFEGLR